MIFGGRTGAKLSGYLIVFGPNMPFLAFPEVKNGQIFDLHYKNTLGDWPNARSQGSMTSGYGAFYLFGGCGAAP